MNLEKAHFLARMARTAGFVVDSISLYDTAADTWSVRIRLEGEWSRTVTSLEDYAAMVRSYTACRHTAIVLRPYEGDGPEQAIMECLDCQQQFGAGDDLRSRQERWELNRQLILMRSQLRQLELEPRKAPLQ